jgi:hypothetical protein
MHRASADRVDWFCNFVRENAAYADGYGRWFSNPLPVQTKALDLVHKLQWQRGEGANMWRLLHKGPLHQGLPYAVVRRGRQCVGC